MEDNLRRFNGDKHTKEDVQKYIISYLEERLIKYAYAGQPVEAIAEAALIVKGAFEQLDIDYAVPEDNPKPKNQAR